MPSPASIARIQNYRHNGVVVNLSRRTQQALKLGPDTTLKLSLLPPNVIHLQEVPTKIDSITPELTRTRAANPYNLVFPITQFCAAHGLTIPHNTKVTISGSKRHLGRVSFTIPVNATPTFTRPAKQVPDLLGTWGNGSHTAVLHANATTCKAIGISGHYLVTYDPDSGQLRFTATTEPLTPRHLRSSALKERSLVVRLSSESLFYVSRLLQLYNVVLERRRYPITKTTTGFFIILKPTPTQPPVPVSKPTQAPAQATKAPIQPVPIRSDKPTRLYHVSVKLSISPTEFVYLSQNDDPAQLQAEIAKQIFPLLPDAHQLIAMQEMKPTGSSGLYQIPGLMGVGQPTD